MTTRRGHTRDDVRKAYARSCRLRCEDCQRLCPTDHVYEHVLDCCGMRVVHALRSSDLEPRVIRNPIAGGWLVGPTRSKSTGGDAR